MQKLVYHTVFVVCARLAVKKTLPKKVTMSSAELVKHTPFKATKRRKNNLQNTAKQVSADHKMLAKQNKNVRRSNHGLYGCFARRLLVV